MYYDYSVLAMSARGICAGIKNKVKIGDIIFVNCLWNCEGGKNDANGKFQANSYQYHPSDIWIQRIQRLGSNKSLAQIHNNYAIHCAPITTGDKVRRDEKSI